MGLLEIKILELRCLSLRDANGSFPTTIKLKIGNGKIGNWEKIHSKINYTENGGNILFNWSFPLKYKSKYPNIIIKISEDTFLGNILGECRIDVQQLYKQSLNQFCSSYFLCAPIQPTFYFLPFKSSSSSLSTTTASQTSLNSTTSASQTTNMSFSTTTNIERSTTIYHETIGEILLNVTIYPKLTSFYQIYNFDSMDKEVVQSMNNNGNNSNSNSNSIASNPPKRKSSLIRNSQKIIDVIKGIKLHSNSNSHNNNNSNNSNSNNSNNNNNQNANIANMNSNINNNSNFKNYFQESKINYQVDQVKILVIDCVGFDSIINPPVMIGCQIKIGLQESKKETTIKSSNQLSWNECFEIPLSNPLQRFPSSTQNLIFYFRDYTSISAIPLNGNDQQQQNPPPTIIAESKELDLYSLEREKTLEMEIPITINDSRYSNNGSNNNVTIRILLRYETGYLNLQDSAELLFQAVCGQDYNLISSLLRQGVDINQCFKDSKSNGIDEEDKAVYTTPLIKAAKQGNIRVVKKLLEMGASTHATDYEGFTALMKCVQYDGIFQPSNFSLVKLLLEYGSDPYLKNIYQECTFNYCNSWDMKSYLESSISTKFYKISFFLCPKCKHMDFPESRVDINSNSNYDCLCPRCGNRVTLDPVSYKDGYFTEFELENLNLFIQEYQHQQHHHYYHSFYLQQCGICKSFGFIHEDQGKTYHHLVHKPSCTTPSVTYTRLLSNPKDIHYNLFEFINQFDQLCNNTSIISISNNSNNNHSNINNNNNNNNSISNFSLNSNNKRKKQNNLIYKLPFELIQHIFNQLTDWRDLKNCSEVSWCFYQICSQDYMFWKNKIIKTFCNITNSQLVSNTEQQTIINNNNNNNNSNNESNLILSAYYKSLYIQFYDLQEWVRILLLEESFRPHYIMKMDGQTGNLTVTLTLKSTKYLFNKDGASFNFHNQFTLSLEFTTKKKIQSIRINALNQPIESIIDLCQLLSIPTTSSSRSPSSSSPPITMEMLQNHVGTASISLVLQSNAINRWIDTYLQHMIPGFHSFLMIKDDVGGSIVLDFYYYDIETLILNPPNVINNN
ncbi:hypothetical protein CYY_009669 [Polysphondylium violaceum]|uniref:F-box domain-containing protein n=1 Tax=Polysphondylium violaceum TaxID=133409 RepID=A0A8J4PJX1_9MYCE|nr:hypothetical protein CYY_009669 [Polysphondylium violaceum]